MKLKKVLGNFMLFITSVFMISGTTSVMGIGVEEMPESIKNLR